MSLRPSRPLSVITCPDCDGLTFTLRPCGCTDYGDRFLVDQAETGVGREAYRDCQVCRGAGSVATACPRCRQRGRRRAQLVFTMVNLDSGAVASASVLPGTVAPTRADAGWRLDLAPLLRGLADTVGLPDAHPEPPIPLPAGWHPELPADRRTELEARAIAERDRIPWRVVLGRADQPPAPDPDARLARLCAVADLLLLDLVVEARRTGFGDLNWEVRYELPGGDIPAGQRGQARDLPAALAATDVAEALVDLRARGRAAPAHELRPTPPTGQRPDRTDADQLERRIFADCVDLATGTGLPGAQAIWRDGRWWHTGLRPGGRTEQLTERPTGQVVRRHTTALLRRAEPLAPSWWGDPIRYAPCPDCLPGSALRVCDCVRPRRIAHPADAGPRPADPDCPDCGGTGVHPRRLACHRCRGAQRTYPELLVTVTDLADRVVHLHWRAGDEPAAPQIAAQPAGQPVVQLPEPYRLASWAHTLGVRPEDLVDTDDNVPVEQYLREGVVTLPGPDADPVREHLAQAGDSRAAARLLVLGVVPSAPSVPELVRLALGLDLALVVTVQDCAPLRDDPVSVHGLLWSVDVCARSALSDDLPYHGSPEAAAATCWEYVDGAFADAVPVNPAEAIPTPAYPGVGLIDDPVPAISRLARRYAGRTVSVRFDRSGCVVLLHQVDGCARVLANAPDLPTAMDALGLPGTA
ncbi:hypothetical protein [Micromonospora zhanjiangensis]